MKKNFGTCFFSVCRRIGLSTIKKAALRGSFFDVKRALLKHYFRAIRRLMYLPRISNSRLTRVPG